MASQLSQNPISEVAHIAVINGKANNRSDVSGQVALQSRHEVRPLPSGLISTSRARDQWFFFFSNVRWVEKLHEFEDQVRRLTLEDRNAIPCQPVFKVIESRQGSVNYFFKQLFAIGLEEVLEIFSGKIFFIAVFISNVSFADIGNARDRSVGNVTMFSSISGSESTNVKNLKP
jgi:hypothetical protein